MTATALEAAPLRFTLEPVRRLEHNIGRVLLGKDEAVRLAVVALLAEGHLLLEDVPGVGKTTLAQALARSLGLRFQRIQFTSDLLPSDIVGISVYKQAAESFEFLPGPLFANVVLADEINRATPKTQSALLEAMSEGKVTVDRKRYQLPRPFLVLATQNPLEYQGTFPLPESQLDRFFMSLSLGYPPRHEERALLRSGGVTAELNNLEAVVSLEELLALQEQVRQVQVGEKVTDYMLALAEATRAGGELVLGVSTRGLQGLYRATQALALAEGRDFVVPDDVQRLAGPVLAHRVLLRRGGHEVGAARRVLEKLLAGLPVPV
jgi:MoxR-like ATPase